MSLGLFVADGHVIVSRDFISFDSILSLDDFASFRVCLRRLPVARLRRWNETLSLLLVGPQSRNRATI
jgi:hypothetical protein